MVRLESSLCSPAVAPAVVLSGAVEAWVRTVVSDLVDTEARLSRVEEGCKGNSYAVVVWMGKGGAGSAGAGLGGRPRRFLPLELPEFVDSSCGGGWGVLAMASGPAGCVEGPAICSARDGGAP